MLRAETRRSQAKTSLRDALWFFLFLVAQPAYGEQVLHIGNGAEAESLDPHKAQTVPAMNIARDLFEGLTRLAPDGSAVPAAAERWELGAGGTTYTFHLRANLQWSNGDPLTAQDFAAGLRRTLDPATGSAYGPVFTVIANGEEVLNARRPAADLGVEALDPQRLRIRLARPAPHLPGLLALPAAAPLHASRAGDPGLPVQPGLLVGNGAYVLDQWVLQSHVRLRRNPRYWNDAATAVDVVYFHPTEDRDTELKRYRAKELDITYSVPQARAGWIRRNLPADLRIAPYLGTYYLGFNCTAAPFQAQPGLRRALSLAVDREVIARKVLRGLGLPADHWVPDGVADYGSPRPPEAGWSAQRRLEEARRLYAEAGYSDGRPLEFSLRYSTSPDNRRLAIVLAAMWKQALGARVRLVNEENKVVLGRLRRRDDTQAFLWSWIGDYNDALTFAQVLQAGSGVNYSGWSDAAYDQLLEQAAAVADPAARRSALEQAEARLLAELPIAPLYFYVSRHLVRPGIEGWSDHILDYHYSQDLRVRR